MGEYDVALICKNGHIINDQVKDNPINNSNFCSLCGAGAISKCEHCNNLIRGFFHGNYEDYEMSEGLDTIPAFCSNCGAPYPWTEGRLKALNELLALSNLGEEDKKEFNGNLQDIISDTPRTKVAALKIKLIGSKVGKEIWDIAKPILAAIGSAAAKQTLGI